MTVQHVCIAFERARGHMDDGLAVAGADLAAHRNAQHAELADGSELFERSFGCLAVVTGVGDDTDEVAALALDFREIADMAKQAAKRRAQHVQNS